MTNAKHEFAPNELRDLTGNALKNRQLFVDSIIRKMKPLALDNLAYNVIWRSRTRLQKLFGFRHWFKVTSWSGDIMSFEESVFVLENYWERVDTVSSNMYVTYREPHRYQVLTDGPHYSAIRELFYELNKGKNWIEKIKQLHENISCVTPTNTLISDELLDQILYWDAFEVK